MTDTQRKVLEEAIEAEKTSVVVNYTDVQLEVLIEFELYAKVQKIADEAFNQSLKNSLRGVMNQAILAKDKALRKGQKMVADALEEEYQKAHGYLIKL